MDDDLVGGHVRAIWHRSVMWAVDELLKLGADQLRHLKVRSGEHLAAIPTTAFLVRPPSSIDTSGEVDLSFSPLDESTDRRGWFDSFLPAAFEVKSMPGDYRKVESEIDRLIRQGQDATGLGVSGVFRGADDVLLDAADLFARAARSLEDKVGRTASKHVFLVVHPFDHPAVEPWSRLFVAPLLAPLTIPTDLETVWVLWFPDHLTMWSRTDNRWTELFFRAVDQDEVTGDPSTGLSVLQEAEVEFLSRVHPHGGRSPYLYGFAEPPEPD